MINWFRKFQRQSPSNSTLAKSIPMELSAQETLPMGQADHADPLKSLLKRGNDYLDKGLNDQAAQCYRKVIELDPGSVPARVNLGFVLRELGQPAEAAEQLEQVLVLDPDQVDALFLLGLKAQAEGDLARATEFLRRCHDKHPGFGPVVVPLCNVLLACGEAEQAQAVAQEALSGNSESAEFHCVLASIQAARRMFVEALQNYDRAVRLTPSDAGAWHRRGNVLNSLHRLDEAQLSIAHSLQLDPDSAAAHNDQGSVLSSMKQFDRALMHLDRALNIQPGLAVALANRGEVLKGLRRFQEAAQNYEMLLSIDPDYDLALGSLLWSRIYICDWTDYDQLALRVCDAVGQDRYVMNPWGFLAVCNSAPLHLQCARMFASRRYPSAKQPLWSKQGGKRGNIRVAYLSADFHNHATSYLMAELFEKHDRDRFSTFGISFGPPSPGAMRDRLTRSFHEFLDVRDTSDADIAHLLREREIDIAVDLKGYTGDARPGILALRPASIQVNYLGFPGTMGADHIDYLLADRHVIPFDEQGSYSEKIVYLPASYQVNDSKRRIAEATPTRSAVGLPDRGFVFCSFNNSFKITPRVFGVWMDLLRVIEGSVLWLLGDSAAAVGNLRKEASLRGIAPDRLIFAPRLDQEEHLARQRLADLFLDTVPCNAHTSASDALWVGLPVLTSVGATFAGRVAASLLDALELKELVAIDLEEYRSKAIWLAQNPHELLALRSRLASQRRTSALFDGARFAVHLETAYTTMMQRWHEGLAPASFSVPTQVV